MRRRFISIVLLLVITLTGCSKSQTVAFDKIEFNEKFDSLYHENKYAMGLWLMNNYDFRSKTYNDITRDLLNSSAEDVEQAHLTIGLENYKGCFLFLCVYDEDSVYNDQKRMIIDFSDGIVSSVRIEELTSFSADTWRIVEELSF